MRSPLEIGPLDPATADEVRALAAAAQEADGVAPLSEQPLLRLGVDDEDLTHVVAYDGEGTVTGYAQVDRGGEVASAELVVHPAARRRRTGRMLLRTAQRDATLPARSGEPGQHGGVLHVWAHGDLPAARAFAADAGLVVVRELWKMGLDLRSGTWALPEIPTGLRLRTFRPGPDDDAWLRVNARAFAHHPEQGRLTQADLDARLAEDWFDPEGFFLLEREDGSLAGSLWTKVPTDQAGAHREGEIYVVGVDPDAQGQGLGKVLTAVGLAHLAALGLDRAVLYVDGDNAAATRTYLGAGFGKDTVDVQYGPPAVNPVTQSSPSDATMKS
ncbi:mycothiol synthase [Oerskovia jenensis]|uniref:Mycothiol acetyltransferase n=1 Tax=Oerskovia jenensis TaxID=162169 RepID=A0ABS2LE74_9CELL|nr:mycothiol synthase [Oerskovia jenensis]MBM7478720.1 mycothiol synthase [Oerskovia jenensis]